MMPNLFDSVNVVLALTPGAVCAGRQSQHYIHAYLERILHDRQMTKENDEIHFSVICGPYT